METPDILRRILATKAEEIQERSRKVSLRALRQSAESAGTCRPFRGALERRIEEGKPAVIAEIKRASPSKGLLRETFEPRLIARSYERGGASCLSVLTDREYFQGSEAHLAEARVACSLPVLRKDFTLDAYQVYEARAIGADCILLIVAVLDDVRMAELGLLARELGMDVLVEVHDRGELQRALALNFGILGINNRDLRSFNTSLDTTLSLLAEVPPDRLIVTESGIHTCEDIARLRAHDVQAFLVGEAFMRAEDPGMKLRELFGASSGDRR